MSSKLSKAQKSTFQRLKEFFQGSLCDGIRGELLFSILKKDFIQSLGFFQILNLLLHLGVKVHLLIERAHSKLEFLYHRGIDFRENVKRGQDMSGVHSWLVDLVNQKS